MFTRSGLVESDSAGAPSSAWSPETESSSAAAPRRSPQDCLESLRRTIEAEIIPRLMLAHQSSSNDATSCAELRMDVDGGEVEALTELVLRHEAQAAQAYVRKRRLGGLGVEAMYLRLLAPVAEQLGRMWEADLCDFAQVTVALWRLQQLVFEFSPAFQSERRATASIRKALLVPAPGSQHTFGAVIVREFFQRAGWEVHGDPGDRVAEIGQALASDRFDLIGLSVGSECHLEAVASAILELRKVSLNPKIIVMVGGPVAALTPDFTSLVGADGTAPDAASAVIEADRLMAARAAPG